MPRQALCFDCHPRVENVQPHWYWLTTTVAAMTLSEPSRMRRLAAKHPIIAKKLYLLMSV